MFCFRFGYEYSNNIWNIFKGVFACGHSRLQKQKEVRDFNHRKVSLPLLLILPLQNCLNAQPPYVNDKQNKGNQLIRLRRVIFFFFAIIIRAITAAALVTSTTRIFLGLVHTGIPYNEDR